MAAWQVDQGFPEEVAEAFEGVCIEVYMICEVSFACACVQF